MKRKKNPDDEEETQLARLDADTTLPPALGAIVSGFARSVSALESIAKSLLSNQDKQQDAINGLTSQLAQMQKERKRDKAMGSLAASEAEALEGLRMRANGPINYGDGTRDNLERLGNEEDPRF